MSQLKLVSALSVAMATLFATSAFAGSATTNLGVTASVSDNCIISTADVAFGAYDPIVANASAALDGTGTVTITCTSGASAVLTLGQGLNDSAGTDADPARRMRLPATSNYLSYTLFSDLGTTEWGNTAGTGVSESGTGTASAHTVYGSVDAAQNVPRGNYVDTVVATVTF